MRAIPNYSRASQPPQPSSSDELPDEPLLPLELPDPPDFPLFPLEDDEDPGPHQPGWPQPPCQSPLLLSDEPLDPLEEPEPPLLPLFPLEEDEEEPQPGGPHHGPPQSPLDDEEDPDPDLPLFPEPEDPDLPDFPEPEDELGDQSSDDELEEPHQPSADTAVAVARSARVVFIVRLF